MKRTKVVLVADDERPICDLLADLLEDEGYRVERAYDGLAALAAAERQRPDLILTDVMMPRLDGVSLIRRLRDRGVRAPALVMSAVFSDVDLPHIHFVPKPFDVDDILATVERLTQRADRTATRSGLARHWRPPVRARRHRHAHPKSNAQPRFGQPGPHSPRS